MIIQQQRCFGLTRLVVSLVTFLFIGQVHALGLGKLSVLSALDEPLVAEIQLTAVTDEALESLEISLGSEEDFARAGIDRASFLQQLEFQVIKVGDPAVRINTTQPAKEPFLHFLIRAEWSDGKLVREYTALLDPPLYAAQQPAAVSAPATEEMTQPQPAPAESTVTSPPEESQSVEESSAVTGPQSGFSGAEYGLTERGDTLWGIASQLDVSGYDVNIFQIMIALQRENQEAFEAGNINRLKVGQILRLSDIESIASISVEDASRSYTAQLEEWESYKLALAEAGDVLKVPAQDTSAVGVAETTTESAPAMTEQAPSATESAAGAAAPAAEVSAAAPATQEEQPTAEAQAPDAAPAVEEDATEAAEAAEAEAATSEQDLLKIVRATLEQEEGEAAGSAESQAELDAAKAESAAEVSALRDQIATIEEALVSSELQNKQLQERITLLEGQVENAQRLVDLENEELALAQQQAAEAQKLALEAKQQAEQQMAEAQKLLTQAEQQMTEAQQEVTQAEQQALQKIAAAEQQAKQQVAQAEQAAAQKIAQAEQLAADQVSQAEQQAEQQVQQAEQQALQAQQQPAQAPAAVAEPKQDIVEPIAAEPQQAAPQPVSQKPSKAWWESLLDMLVGSSITVIAAVVGILVLLVSLLLIMRRRRSIAEFEESILTGSALDGQTETTETEATATGTDTSFLSDFGMAGMGTMQADEVDPLAEAEVYLAYGRDEQAEEVLKEAAARDTGRHELKLKLLEIYQQRNDLNSFETLAEELYPAGGQGDAAAWAKVVEMGLKMNPDNPLFSQEVTAVTENLTEALPATVKEALSDGGESFEPLSDTSTSQPEQEPAGAEKEELTMDLPKAVADFTPPVGEQVPTLSADADDDAFATDSASPQEQVKRDIAASADTLDTELSPFPAPDQDTGLDEELDRLSKQMEETSASVSAEQGDQKQPSAEADMLNFATTDPSEIAFDMDLDDADASSTDTQVDEIKAAAVEEEAPPQPANLEAKGDEFVDLDLELADEAENELVQAQAESEKDQTDEEFLNLDFGETAEADTRKDDEISFELEPEYGGDVPAAGDDGEDTSEKWDEAATKLDLAQAYLNMGDKAGARSIIDEVMKEGSPAQKNQAAELAAQIS